MVKMSLPRKRIVWAIIILLLLVAIVGGAWWLYYAKTGVTPGQSSKDALASLCEGDAAKRMQDAIAAGDIDTLSSQADKITAIESYTSNASCVYIVAEASAIKGETEEAKRNYTTLTTLRSEGQTLDAGFSQPEVQIEILGEVIKNNEATNGGMQVDSESGTLPADGAPINGGKE